MPTWEHPRASRRAKGRTDLDEDGVREFLRTDYPRLVGALTFLTGSRAASEDAVHEALGRAWERSERGEELRSLPAWVTTVAYNLARSGLRRRLAERRARQRIVVAESAGLGESEVELRMAIEGLPRRQREGIVLHYYLGFGVADVARVLGVAEGTVKSALHRARQALERALTDEEGSDAPGR